MRKIFREQTSSVGVRPQLDTALEFMREGDVLVVTKLDQLARFVADLIRIIQALERKGLACGFSTGYEHAHRKTDVESVSGWCGEHH